MGEDHPHTAKAYGDLGNAYLRNGQHEEAIDALEKCAMIRRQALGPNHEATAQALNYLGVALRKSGQTALAIEKLQSALAIRRKRLAGDHPLIATSLKELGNAFIDLKDIERGRALLNECLLMRLRIFGPRHPATASVYESLAMSYEGQKLWREALDMLKLSLQSRRQKHIYFMTKPSSSVEAGLEKGWDAQRPAEFEVQEREYPSPASTYRDVQLANKDRMELEREIAFRWQELNAKLHGKDKVDTAFLMDNLGIALRKNGEYDEAVALHEKALELRKLHLGSGHSLAAQTLGNLGIALRERGDIERSIAILSQALEALVNKLGPMHRLTAGAHEQLALSYKTCNKLDEAIEHFRKAYSITRTIDTEYEVGTAAAAENLGAALQQRGDLAEAIKLHEKALMIRKNRLKKRHPSFVVLYEHLAQCYVVTRQWTKAIEAHEQLVWRREEQFGVVHPVTADWYDRLGFAYEQNHEFDKASEIYLKSLKIRSQVGQNPQTPLSLFNVGVALFRKGDIMKAKEYLEKSHRSRENLKLRESHPDTASLYEYMGLIQEQVGNLPDAIRLIRRAVDIRRGLVARQIDYEDAKSYKRAGELALRSGDYDRAIEQIAKSISEVRRDSAANYRDEAFDSALNLRTKPQGEVSTSKAYRQTKAVDVASLYDKLALAYRECGEEGDGIDKAIALQKKTLRIRRETRGEQNALTASAYDKLGTTYLKKGTYPRALKFFNIALEIRKRNQGENAMETAASYYHVGDAEFRLGQYRRALEFYQKSLAIRESALGQNHPHSPIWYDKLGQVYFKLRQYEKALQLYERSLAVRLRTKGSEDLSVAASYHNIGMVLLRSNAYEEAVDYLTKCLTIRQQQLDDAEGHPFVASTYDCLGMVYLKMKNYDVALAMFRKCLATKRLGSGKKDIKLYEKRLAEQEQLVQDLRFPKSYEALSQSNEAEDVLEYDEEAFKHIETRVAMQDDQRHRQLLQEVESGVFDVGTQPENEGSVGFNVDFAEEEVVGHEVGRTPA
eukprot:scaffold49_cov409-Prasinococcus_capsulatus_cf.AAC.39